MMLRTLHRVVLAVLGVALATATAASAHHPGGGHEIGRIPGKPDVERLGNELHRYNAETRTYTVSRRGGPTTEMHYHEVSTAAQLPQDVFALQVELPTEQDGPVCASSGHRIVAVRAWSDVEPTTPGAAEQIRALVRRMNWKFMQQSRLSSDGARVLQMKVDCSPAGAINVHDVKVPLNYLGNGIDTTDGDVDSLDAGNYVRNVALGRPERCCPGNDGSRAVKYLVIHDEGGTSERRGLASDDGLDRDKVSSDVYTNNPADAATSWTRTNTSWGLATIGTYTTIAMHEMVHVLGAVDESAPFSSPGSHCTEEIDLMCDPAYMVGTRCPESAGYGTPNGVPVDCGFDTYFDSVSEPGEWLHQWWNVGGSENPFLTSEPTMKDTIGVFRPSTGTWYLRNSNTSGAHHYAPLFGGSGHQGVVGDWDGDGDDTIGVFQPSTGSWYLRNSNTSGSHDLAPFFGSSSDVAVVGDWDGDGDDTIGVFRPSTGTWYLRNSNTSGPHDAAFPFGVGSDRPVVGDWDSQ